MGNLILFLLLFVSRLLFLSPLPIYFDSPEYMKLIANPNLFQALVTGHEPIHPGFILPAWVLYRALPLSSLYAAELVSSLFSALGLFVFFKTVKLYFGKEIAASSLIIASILPVLFLAGVNALTDTTYIFFYLFAFYALSKLLLRFRGKPGMTGKDVWFSLGALSLAYAVFTHTQVIIWLPLFFTPLLFFRINAKSPNKSAHNQGLTLTSRDEGLTLSSLSEGQTLKVIVIFIVSGVGVGVLGLVFLLVMAGSSIFSSLNLLFMHGGDFITSQNVILAITRALRNLAIPLLRNNSTLVILYSIFGLILLTRTDKKKAILLLIWLFPVLLTSQYWHIGLFGRTSLVASFPLAILAAHVKPKSYMLF